MAGAKGLIGALRVGIVADTRKASRDLKRFQSQTKSFGSSMKKHFGMATKAVGGFFGIAGIGGLAGFTASLRKTALEIDEIAKSADKLGTGTEELIRLRHAAEIFGTTSDAVQKGMQKMLRSVAEANTGLATQSRAFEMLGLNAAKLEKLKADKIFLEIAAAVNELDSNAKKMQAANDIFGRGGVEMLNLIKASGTELAETMRMADELGLTFSREQAKNVEAFNDAVVELKAAFGGEIRDIVIDIAPGAAELVRSMRLLIPELKTFAVELWKSVQALHRIALFASPAYAVYNKVLDRRTEAAKLRAVSTPHPELRGPAREAQRSILEREILETNKDQARSLQEISQKLQPAFDIP